MPTFLSGGLICAPWFDLLKRDYFQKSIDLMVLVSLSVNLHMRWSWWSLCVLYEKFDIHFKGDIAFLTQNKSIKFDLKRWLSNIYGTKWSQNYLHTSSKKLCYFSFDIYMCLAWKIGARINPVRRLTLGYKMYLPRAMMKRV